jgi:hypothetical protein
VEQLRRISSLVAAVALCACHSVSAPRLEVVPVSDTVVALAQHEGYEFSVISKLVNHTDKAAYLDRCSYSVQVSEQNRWRTVDASICGSDIGTWVVPPRASLEIPITIHDDRSYRILTRRGPLKSGKYRVQFSEITHSKRWFAKRSRRIYTSSPFIVIIQSLTPLSHARRVTEAASGT